MNTIQIIGLGTKGLNDLTVKAYNALTENVPTFIRTKNHPIINELEMLKNSIQEKSNEEIFEVQYFDDYFEKYESFEDVYDNIIKKIVELSQKYAKINYCTAGSPFHGDIVAKKLIEEYGSQINIITVDGISFLDRCIKLSNAMEYKSVLILDSLEIDEFSFDVNSLNIITQVDNKDIASLLKLKLMEIYPDDIEVIKVNVLEENSKKIPLYLLDQEKKYGFSTYFCILPIDKMKKAVYNIDNLSRTMKILRSPDGCPWDRGQDHVSIRQNLIEEAYEVVDAIDNDDVDNLVEELGDVLLQVVFHSEIASEDGYFNLNDVVSNVCKKLYFRHPHVFSENKAKDSEDALRHWEESKQKEKNIKSYTENLKNVPKALSPLSRSYKIQKRASDVGFDWDDINGAIEKVKEELFEFLDEIKSDNFNRAEEEFGDLLFAMVNIARFMKINPDIALNRTINKFINRFEFIEKNAEKDLKEMTLQQMDELWEKSKIPTGI